MSRALGDLQYKNPVNTLDVDGTAKSRRASASSTAPEARGNFLSNQPHLRSIQLHRDRRYMLLCCSDGVSDLTDEKRLMEHAMKEFMAGKRATDIAKQITTLTTGRPESDNSTCVIAFFDGINT
jgi:serine/threonine protein phosphatase PrpC